MSVRLLLDLCVFGVFGTALLYAHAALVTSQPAFNATVKRPSFPILLTFNSRVDQKRFTLTLGGPHGFLAVLFRAGTLAFGSLAAGEFIFAFLVTTRRLLPALAGGSSLTSQPPGVDLKGDRVIMPTIVARMTPEVPRPQTPPISSLSPSTLPSFHAR